jgi:hypothetical protein
MENHGIKMSHLWLTYKNVAYFCGQLNLLRTNLRNSSAGGGDGGPARVRAWLSIGGGLCWWACSWERKGWGLGLVFLLFPTKHCHPLLGLCEPMEDGLKDETDEIPPCGRKQQECRINVSFHMVNQIYSQIYPAFTSVCQCGNEWHLDAHHKW